MNMNDRIKRALIRYLKDELGTEATHAYLGNTEFDTYSSGGCDTCGFGSVTEMSFDIYFSTIDGRSSSVTIPGDPLNFFPTLFEYMVD